MLHDENDYPIVTLISTVHALNFPFLFFFSFFSFFLNILYLNCVSTGNKLITDFNINMSDSSQNSSDLNLKK